MINMKKESKPDLVPDSFKNIEVKGQTVSAELEVAQIEQALGMNGHMIGHSKTFYRLGHPDNLIVFNARIFLDGKPVWWGDIDVSISKDKLIELAKNLNKPFSIYYESNGEVITFLPDSSYKLVENLKQYFKI